MDNKKRHLFPLDERFWNTIIFLIILSVLIILIVSLFTFNFNDQSSIVQFILILSIFFPVLIIMSIIINFQLYTFSYAFIFNEKIEFICYKKKYSKNIFFKDIKQLQVIELSYYGYRRFSVQQFILISKKHIHLNKSKYKVDNYIGYLKNKDLILMQYSEKNYNDLTLAIDKFKTNTLIQT